MKPEFVEIIPNNLEQDVLYISQKYEIAIHLCACGCRKQTVTPFSKGEWQLKIDGEIVSLFPSIGNWQFECKSHYWITNNEIIWA